jgi:glycosyltransferase involved in cell wall biosynthesis
MKIAILVAAFPPKWLAGTEIATYNIAKYLAKLGHEVHVITSLDEELARESTKDGFDIHRVRAIKKSNLLTLSFLLPAFSVVRRISPDIVHAQSIPMGLCALLIKRFLKKPYIVYSRGESYMSWAFRATISKLVLKNADAVIALTSDMKRDLSEIYTGHISVIPNGIELDKFTGLSRQESRVRLKISGENRVILFVGRLRPQKNVACLINAMKIIVEHNPKTKLLIIGDGQEEEELKGLTKKLNLGEYIEFVGKVPHEKIPVYMSVADVFILPSLFEGLPNVILEAMAAGLPVVVTRVSGLWEIVIDGVNGFLVEPGVPEQISDKALLLLENDELRERMASENKRNVVEYTWPSTVQKIIDVYLGCLCCR